MGAIIGGNVGGLVAQGTRAGLGIYYLRYKREYEEQADILATQIMSRAGYDPRDLAEMFRTIEPAEFQRARRFLLAMAPASSIQQTIRSRS